MTYTRTTARQRKDAALARLRYFWVSNRGSYFGERRAWKATRHELKRTRNPAHRIALLAHRHRPAPGRELQ